MNRAIFFKTGLLIAIAMLSGCATVRSSYLGTPMGSNSSDGGKSAPITTDRAQQEAARQQATQQKRAQEEAAQRRSEQQKPAQLEESGLTYYLPMRYAEVTFERRRIAAKPTESIDDARKKLADAVSARDEAGKKHAQAAERVAAMRASGIPNTSKIFQKLVMEEIEAKLSLAAAEEGVAKAKAAVTRTIGNEQAWDSSQAQCGYVDVFAVTLLKPVPDIRARFSLKLRHNATRNEDWTFATTTSGLLSTVDGTIEDQSAEILMALARSQAAIDSGGSVPEVAVLKPKVNFFTSGQEQEDPKNPCNLAWKPLILQRTLDPSKGSDWGTFFEEIKNAAKVECKPEKKCEPASREFDYRLSPELHQGPDARVETSAAGKAWGGEPGIYYRREIPLHIRIANGKDSAGAFMLMVPNHAPADMIPLRASPFVTTKHRLGFDNGILVSVHSERPSELLRVAALPWDIANATIGAVTQLVRLRVDYAKGNADLVEEQIRLLEQLKKQLEAQQALDAVSKDEEDAGL